MNSSTDNVVIARYAGAMYDLVLDNGTANEVLAATATVGLDAFLNAVYLRDFGIATSESVADTIVKNARLTADAAKQGDLFLVGVLDATAPEQRGAAIADVLNQFAQLTSDPTFGAGATSFEAEVTTAVSYSENPSNTTFAGFNTVALYPDIVVITRYAVAMYDLFLDNGTANEVLAATTTLGVNPFLNAVYQRDFGLVTTTFVAETIVKNVGLTGDAAKQGALFLVGVLDATAPEQRGATVANVLNQFAQLTSDPTFGTAAIAWEARVTNAIAYSQNPCNQPIIRPQDDTFIAQISVINDELVDFGVVDFRNGNDVLRFIGGPDGSATNYVEDTTSGTGFVSVRSAAKNALAGDAALVYVVVEDNNGDSYAFFDGNFDHKLTTNGYDYAVLLVGTSLAGIAFGDIVAVAC